MNARRDPEVHMIPLDQITVLNPRERGKRKFEQIVTNIAKLGLKKPITVTLKNQACIDEGYYLVCGQGRYEAYVILEQIEIPAIVVEVSKQELLLMSLVENLARRQHTTVELAREMTNLKNRGYSVQEIAAKTDLDPVYVRGIVKLLNSGEERLVNAVEKGRIPLSVAISIAGADDKEIQRALSEAYENKDLRGKKLLAARRLLEKRRNRGKAIRTGNQVHNGQSASSETLLKTFREETARQRLVVEKSKLCETRLLFVISALKQLFQDENFVNLLRAESLDTLPQNLAAQIEGSAKHEAGQAS